jgi:enoyl-[acyl-carrier protein] reductase II
MEALGATAIVAEGGESGGHVGMVNTMTLVPMVTAAVKIPVIAAGGIADGRGFIAALAMGAIGIQMGTAFLTTKECPIHPSYKERLIAAAETDTVVTGLGTKEPVRCVRNPLTDNYFAMLKQNLPQEELMKPLKGSLYRAVNGDLTTGSIQAGQITGMLQEIKTVRQVMEDVMNSAEQVLQRLRVCPKSLASKIRW